MGNITKLLMLLGIGLLLAAASIWFIGGKKKEYSVKIAVNARPQQVFPYFADVEKKKLWLTSIVSEELIPSRADIEAEREPVFQEGTHILSTMNLDGETIEMRGNIIRFSQNELLSIKFRNDAMALTRFFHLKLKTSSTEINYRKIIRHNGFQRFFSVFENDNHQAEIEEAISRLAKLLESETGGEVSNEADASDMSDSEKTDEMSKAHPSVDDF